MEKVRRDPASLSQLVKDFDLEVVYKGLDYDTRMITIPDVNRPALQLVGFYDYFEPKRLQILGKAEFTFLKAMPLEQRRKVFEDLLRCELEKLSEQVVEELANIELTSFGEFNDCVSRTVRSAPSIWRILHRMRSR